MKLSTKKHTPCWMRETANTQENLLNATGETLYYLDGNCPIYKK